MSTTRREFGSLALLLAARPRTAFAADSVDAALRAAAKRHGILAGAAMAATVEKTTYAGAFGRRDPAATTGLTIDAIFRIASMTKPVTTVAALQMVERGKVKLDEPVARHLPELASLKVLDGFHPKTGAPVLRPAGTAVTLHHLLTHTSGFAYSIWDENLNRYSQHNKNGKVTPLVFEPGTRWEYGTSVDWAGRLVETLSGQPLEQYFQDNILGPLEMRDTSYILPAEKFDRLMGSYSRQHDGILKVNPRTMPAAPKSFNGGGGLYSTVGDYVLFMQMILRRGSAPGKRRILSAEMVEMMQTNQVGELAAGRLKTTNRDASRDVDFHPGFTDKFGFGFLINTTGYQGGRSAGSLAWAGMANTYFWIDPRRQLCGVLLMSLSPFADEKALAVLGEFERAVYAAQRS